MNRKQRAKPLNREILQTHMVEHRVYGRFAIA
jgi:hypothetical protein